MGRRRRPGGNFGNFGNSSFSKLEKQKTKSRYTVKPIVGDFGGSVPNSIYTSDRNSAWSRWRRGWELATSNGVERPFFYEFGYILPSGTFTEEIIGARSPIISGCMQGFLTKNKELGMHWAGRVNAGNLRFDNLFDQQGQRLSISGELDPKVPFLGSGQNNLSFWYVQLNGTFSAETISGVSAPVPAPLFVKLPDGQTYKPIKGDILEDTIISVSGDAIDVDTRNPLTNRRFGFTRAVVADIDQNNGIIKFVKNGSVQSTIDGILITPAKQPPASPGRFLETGARYACTCQDFTRRLYAYLSDLGLRKSYKFPYTKVASIKPGREEEFKQRGRILNAAQTDIVSGLINNRTMTIIYPSGEDNRYAVPGVSFTESGKNVLDPMNLYRDKPGVYSDFGGVYLRNFGENPEFSSGIAQGMPKYGDYKESGIEILEISDTWSYVLDQYSYCKHINAMLYADKRFPLEPSDFPVDAGSIAEWEAKLVEDTRNEQTKAFEQLGYYGMGYMDVPPFNVQSPIVGPMMQRLLNIPQEFILIPNFLMEDQQGNVYAVASGGKPAVTPQPSGFTISDWDFKVANY